MTRDAVAARSIVRIWLISVAVIVVAVAVAALYLNAAAGSIFDIRIRHDAAPPHGRTVGTLEITPLATEHFAADLRLQAHARLTTFGFIDAAHTTIHIPIEDAFDLLLADTHP